MSATRTRKSSSGLPHPLPDPLSITATRQPLASQTHHLNTPPSAPSTPTTATYQSAPSSAKRNASGPSRAEAYASAHQPRRSKEAINIVDKEKSKQKTGTRERESSGDGRERHLHSIGGGGSKPIFDWISRKLGAGRRASIAEPHSGTSGAVPSNTRNGSSARIVTADGRNSKYTTLPKKRTGGMEVVPPVPSIPMSTPHSSRRPHRSKFEASGNVTRLSIPQPTSLRPRLSPTNIFPQTPGRNSVLSRSESHSLQSYPLFSATPSERERRREANNPYPSMPIQMYKGSIMSSNASAWASASGLGEQSVSFRTRSRTPSIRSVSSSMRPRISIAGEQESLRSTRYSRDMNMPDERQDERNLTTPMEADDNASMRPLPPSHPPSPTPSYSMLSRSASGSLLSPQPRRSRSLVSSRRPQSVGFYSSSSIGNSISEGYGDGDSGGTRYYPTRRDSASTKPTTIISFDSGAGVGHIAQAIPAPITTVTQPHVNAVAGPSVPSQGIATPSMTARSTPISGSPISTTLASSPLRTSFSQDIPYNQRQPAVPNSPVSSHISGPAPPSPTTFQAQPPKHSHPHPIHNPRPSSPPNDNASIMTLASSTFAAPYPPYAPSSMHRPTSIISDRATSTPATPVLGHGMINTQPSGARPIMGTSPSVTFAPVPPMTDSPAPSTNYPTRPSSLAQSHLSVERDQEVIKRPPSLASPVDKDYPPSLHPTLGTRGSASLSHASWGYPGRQAGVDDRASTTAMRRRGSGSSMGSLESRWSWRGNMLGTGAAGVTPALEKRAYDGPEAIAEGIKG